MPPQSSAVLPATAASVQSPATTQYSAEHLAVIKLMAVMTALAVALMVVVTRWFADLDAIPGPLADSLMAEGQLPRRGWRHWHSGHVGRHAGHLGSPGQTSGPHGLDRLIPVFDTPVPRCHACLRFAADICSIGATFP